MPEMTSASFGPHVTIPISKHMPKYFPPPCKSFLVVPKLVSGVACICKCKIVQICSVVEMPAPVSHCTVAASQAAPASWQARSALHVNTPLLSSSLWPLYSLHYSRLHAPPQATSNFCTNSELVSLYHSVTEHEDAFSTNVQITHFCFVFGDGKM